MFFCKVFSMKFFGNFCLKSIVDQMDRFLIFVRFLLKILRSSKRPPPSIIIIGDLYSGRFSQGPFRFWIERTLKLTTRIFQLLWINTLISDPRIKSDVTLILPDIPLSTFLDNIVRFMVKPKLCRLGLGVILEFSENTFLNVYNIGRKRCRKNLSRYRRLFAQF